MFYYLIAPAERTYQGKELLTYSSKKKLASGQAVVVKVRTITTSAFVFREVVKPTFSVNPIDAALTNITIPSNLVKLFEWMNQYYPAGVGATASLYIPRSISKQYETIENNNSVEIIKKSKEPTLTGQQTTIVKTIEQSKTQTHIIHGDTGTGKTLVYIELAKKIIQQKKSVIILTPEISLTPQLAEQFRESFSSLHIVHSGLSSKERRSIWLLIQTCTTPQIVIGPRSALFYPLKSVGMIIVDEFHDSAYKQDQSPRYNAVRVAAMLVKINASKLVLGSATPPIEDYFYALKMGAEVHRLTEKPLDSLANRIHLVNLSAKNERTNYPLLSKTLLDLIHQKLQAKQQIMIFLNKRGSSRLVVCQNCGWHSVCDRCNIPYTYHHDSHFLICHTCASSLPAPNNCPDCLSENILFKNPGTKAITEYLRAIFPQAIIGRYDKDNSKHETFTAQQGKIQQGKVDILVGTQLLVKGHDLPKLSLVAILLADNALQFPDFSSEERAFQLLHQIAGRVGRGHNKGDIVLQTYSPSSKLNDYVEHKINSWQDFYASQLRERQKYNFPPYCYLMKIEIARATEKTAETFARKITTKLLGAATDLEILGPAPSFMYKRSDKWHWQIIVKSKKRSSLIDLIKELPGGCTYDIDPSSLL